MGQGLSVCHPDGSHDAAGRPDPLPYIAASRGSQSLCELQTSSGAAVCATVGKEIHVYGVATGKKFCVLEGHLSPVTCLCSVDGWLYSGSVDKTVRRWDYDTGAIAVTMEGHKGPVWCVAARDDEAFSGSEDMTVIRWDAESGSKLAVLSVHTGPVRFLLESDSVLLSGSDDGKLIRWDTESATQLRVLQHPSKVTCALWSNDGPLFTGSADGAVRRWDVQSGALEATFRGHADWVTSLMLADGSLYSGARDRTIRRWDQRSGALLTLFELGAISFRRKTPDPGFWIVAREDGSVRTQDVHEKDPGGCEKFFKVDHEDGTVSLRTPTGRYLSADPSSGVISAFGSVSGPHERFQLLDVSRGVIAIRTSHGRYVAVLPDGSVGSGQVAEEADPDEDSEQFFHMMIDSHYSGVTCLLALDGSIMSGSADRSVKIWDTSNGLLLASLEARTGMTCLLAVGNVIYAAVTRGQPLRLPRPQLFGHRPRRPPKASGDAAE